MLVLHGKGAGSLKALKITLLDEHENSNKENPRNGEPGCTYTIEY
jgi:hypothetical protein